MLESFTPIGIIVLMIINLFLYHMLFNVIYFELGKGLLKELVGASLRLYLNWQ